MIGDWRDDWEMLRARQQQLEAIYDRRAGGSVEARADLLAFFERSEALRDRTKLALDGSPELPKVDATMKAELPLQLAHDVAIKSKHGKQDQKAWAGVIGGDLVSQSVSVFVGSGGMSTHSWTITYTPKDGQLGEVVVDALVLSRDIVDAWQKLLIDVGLLT